MSVATATTALLDDISRLGGQQRLLRLVLLLTPWVVFAAERAAGGSSSVFYVLLVLVLAVLGAVLPDSSVGLALIVVLALHWAIAVPDPTSAWLLVATFGIIALHVAGTLTTYGPGSLVLPWPFLALWTTRALSVAAVSTLVWLAVRVASGLDLPADARLLGAALVALVGWAVFVGAIVATTEE